MANPTLLAFSTKYRYERVVLKGNSSFTVGANSIYTVTIVHNLGYIPYVEAYYTYNDGKYFNLFSGVGSYNIDGNQVQIDDAWADTVNYNVTFDNFDFVNTYSGAVYYRIYAEPQK